LPTVLVADDDADHRELLTIALRKFGHDVVEAWDTRSAQALIDRGPVDAVLLDVRMPNESGIDLCRRLRERPATSALPIMFVTADVNDHRVVAAMQAGADDYLTKPFHRAELAARLNGLLLVRRPGGPARSSTVAMLAARNALHRPQSVALPRLQPIRHVA
jgi:DNA-binding response OmpR family regulator